MNKNTKINEAEISVNNMIFLFPSIYIILKANRILMGVIAAEQAVVKCYIQEY